MRAYVGRLPRFRSFPVLLLLPPCVASLCDYYPTRGSALLCNLFSHLTAADACFISLPTRCSSGFACRHHERNFCARPPGVFGDGQRLCGTPCRIPPCHRRQCWPQNVCGGQGCAGCCGQRRGRCRPERSQASRRRQARPRGAGPVRRRREEHINAGSPLAFHRCCTSLCWPRMHRCRLQIASRKLVVAFFIFPGHVNFFIAPHTQWYVSIKQEQPTLNASVRGDNSKVTHL